MGIDAPDGLHDAATNELLAMLEVMYLVATADGFFSQEERLEFLQNMATLSGGRIGPEDLAKLVDNWIARGPEEDVGERLRVIAQSLPSPASRRLAYDLGMQIAKADGQYLNSEASMLKMLSDAFALES